MSVNFYDKANDKLNLVAGGTLYADAPVGSIQAYGGTTVPFGWLLCQGQAVSRTTYAELFAIIGTVYGEGDSSTTFNIPDLREATTKGTGLSGKSNTHYDSDGVALGEFVEDRNKGHYHNVYVRDTGHSHTVDAVSAQNAGVSVSLAQCAINITPSTMYPTTSTGSAKAAVEVNGSSVFSSLKQNQTAESGSATNEVKAVGVNYIIKAKHTPVPADFSDSMVGYLGQESNYNLYPWSHARTVETPDDNQDITIERDGWYSIDYTLSSSTDANNSFTFRDTDSQGNVHTIMRSVYDKSGDFRQTFLVPLKAGNYIYSHGGIGTLSVYMNRRDFA